MKKTLPVVLYLLFISIALVMVSTTAFATNGMNLEGYGPIATGMGGASMAYDNGTAAMMNNPATLGLMPEGNRLDVALGYLGPNITAKDESNSFSTTPGASSSSSANAFYMPAIGWVQKAGQMSYGVGMFSQGGMGSEYDANSFLAYGSGEKVRSEVSVGRVLVPFAYEIDKNFSVGASVDFVWAGMDLKMAMNGQQFFNMAGMDMSTPNQHQYGFASGSMVDAFAGMYMAGAFNPANPVPWARFDFSDSSAFTGKAKGTGFGAKVGGVYKVNDDISIGAAYHSKTALSDLETSGAKVSFNVNMDIGYATTGTPNGSYMPATIPLTGKIKVQDFEWPQMAGIGMAFKVSNDLMIVADYKWINWAAVMKEFKMTFTVDAGQAGMAAAFDNTVLNASMDQKWDDQNVIMIGAAYKIDADWTLRGGINYANNPIPDTYLNALFPAIEKTHVIVGAGYMIDKASTIDASFTYAPEVKQTSGPNAPAGGTVTHSQTNAQVMYSYRF
ncbi:MAG: outer membrane protein transport protein [Nitrospirae bacterium]|nr:outer membrane protein transport protein [Nitrospirota bacterium]